LTVSDVGERRLIEYIWESLEKDPEELLGAGLDDAVAKELAEGFVLVAHTDMWVEHTDLLPGMSWRLAGRKAVVANISDLAAKGAKPLGLLFSVGLPPEFPLESLRELVEGLNEGASEYRTHVLGGDLGESKEVVLAGSIFGVAHKGRLMSRSGAQPGDLVAVTGLLGLTAVGFKILLEEYEASGNVKAKAVASVYRPVARLREGLALAGCGAVTASMDISDGLAVSLNQMAEASGVSITLEKLPIAEETKVFAEHHKLDPEELTLYEGGEEYELLVAVRPSMWSEAVKAVKNVGGSLYKIGVVCEGLGVYKADGSKVEAKGWEHLRKNDRLG